MMPDFADVKATYKVNFHIVNLGVAGHTEEAWARVPYISLMLENEESEYVSVESQNRLRSTAIPESMICIERLE
eukprot:CFRG5228T1